MTQKIVSSEDKFYLEQENYLMSENHVNLLQNNTKRYKVLLKMYKFVSGIVKTQGNKNLG